MFDIYGNMKEPPASEPLKVQTTGGKKDGQEKSKLQHIGNTSIISCGYRNVGWSDSMDRPTAG